jgi:hypothetical protein
VWRSDSLAELRRDANERMLEQKARCFLCRQSAQDFDRFANTFQVRCIG